MRWISLLLAGAVSFPGAFAITHPDLHAPCAPLELTPVSLQRLQQRNTTTPNSLTRFLFPRQADGRCGPEGGNQRCKNNQCCSSYGWCGTGFEFCNALVGCQPQYGRCGDAPVETPTPTPTPTPAPTPMPTPSPSTSSTSSTISSSSLIISSRSTVSPPRPSGTLIVSTNGLCGNSTTCASSEFGDCCSDWYWCGNGIDYCGTGCRSGLGNCNNSPPISSSSSSSPIPTPSLSTSSSSTLVPTPTPTSNPTPSPSPSSSSTTRSTRPTPTVPVSTDGQCGNGFSCTGSTYGRCCSSYGWCGSQDDYCRPAFGCQPEWGECSAAP